MVEKIVMATNRIAAKRVDNILKMTLFEKVTASIIFLSVVILMFVAIHTRSSVDALQQRVEKVRYETQVMRDENTILQQKIDSLMTSDRLDKIASEYGLTRNENNVRSVIR